MTIVRGLYLAVGGMLAEQRLLETAANNLANATTPGYRPERREFRAHTGPFLSYVEHDCGCRGGASFLGEVLGEGAGDAVCEGATLDVTQGSLQATTGPLDLALEGEGYFVVWTPAGELLRRSASLVIGPEGTLADAEGNPVLGVEGPLRLERAAELTISEDGTVTQQGQAAGRLRVVSAQGQVTPVGDGLVRAAGTQAAQGYAVRQGYLEIPKGGIVRHMVALIEAFRAYEAGQKAVRAVDETLGWAVREVSALA
jgi:flagellar basal-body rod protein FlgG